MTWGDYGVDTEGYKKYFTEPAGEVLEGAVSSHPATANAASAGAADGWRARAERRLAVILACEPDAVRAAATIGLTAARAAMRRLTPAPSPAAV